MIIGRNYDVTEDARQLSLCRREGQRPELAGAVRFDEIGIRPIALCRDRRADRRCAIHSKRPRGAGSQHPFDCRAPIHHSSLRRMRSRMWSAARYAKAMMVSVGFLSALEANTAPSVMNKFL